MGSEGERDATGEDRASTARQGLPETVDLDPLAMQAAGSSSLDPVEPEGDAPQESAPSAHSDPRVDSDIGHASAPPSPPEVHALSSRLDEIASAVISQSAAIARFHERSAAQEDVITRLHDRVQELQAGETRRLIKPVVGGLVSLYGDILKQSRDIQRDLSLTETQELLDVLAVRVENTLAALGVESYGAQSGDAFDPRRHQAVGVVPTDRPEQHQTVATVLRPGFEDPTESRAMFVAQVTVSKFVEPESVSKRAEAAEQDPVASHEKPYANVPGESEAADDHDRI